MAQKSKSKSRKVKCSRCGHVQKMMSKSFNMRCSMCNGFTQLKKFPDRRFKKNRIGNKKSGNHKVKSDVPSKSVSPSDIREQFETSPTTIALSET